MKLLRLFFVLSAVVILVAACSQNAVNNSTANSNGTTIGSQANTNVQNSAPAGANDELASARKIYTENCAGCHKADGSGGIKDADGKQIKVPNFHSERKMNDKDEDWIDTIANGAKEDGMPAFKGKISDEDIKNLVKFIRQDIQGKK